MIKVSLASLRTISEQRPSGYYDEIISKGSVNGDVLFLEESVYRELRKKFTPSVQAPNRIASAARAGVRVLKATIKGKKVRVSDEEKERRLSICRVCEFYDGHKCKKCGCYMNLKARLETEHCPIQKW